MYNEVIKKLLHKIEILPENLVVMYLMKAYGLSENMARQAVYSACRNRTCYKKGDYLARLPYIETDSSLMKKAAAFRLVIEFLPDSQDFNVGYSPWLVSFLRGNNLVQVCYIERNMELVSSMMIAEKAVPKDERASIKRIAIIENGSDIAKVKMQVHNTIGICVCYIRQFSLHAQRNAKFLLALTYDALFAGFSSFDLAAGELPQQAAIFIRWTLANEDFTVLSYDGCCYFKCFHALTTFLRRNLYSLRILPSSSFSSS